MKMEGFRTNREDFLFFKQNIIYLDSAATALKPHILSEKVAEYYNNYPANAHRGDYDISYKVDELMLKTRYLVSEMLNAKEKEIVFTNNATDSLNKVILGFFTDYLNDGDEVLLTKSEHASNVLPWFELQKKKKIIINYIPLNENLEIDIANVEKSITQKTKVISLAHITNVIGDERPIKEIIQIAHLHNILVLVDGAQSIPHKKVDVQDLDADFLVFSAHKMLGPTGLGVLYGKAKYLEQVKPIIVGGGMNVDFSYDGNHTYSTIPYRLEAGTPNLASIIAFGSIIEYINNIGIETIEEYVLNLREYAVKRLKEIPYIKIYNEHIKTSLITFNCLNTASLDLADYLNKYHICVRAGNHCAKILKDEGLNDTCRISLYFYNTKEEVDYLVEVLSNYCKKM